MKKIHLYKISDETRNMSKNEISVAKSDQIEEKKVEQAEKVSVQWLIGKESDVDCYMRKFTFHPGGKMPSHKHENLYHLQYILEGKLKTTIEDQAHYVESGDFLLIPSGKVHSYENESGNKVQFICLIPADKDGKTQLIDEK